MADRGILFSAPMIRALLDGRKTQTRRLIKPQPPKECSIHYMLGRESWQPADQQTPLRHEWEAWHGPLFEQRPAKAIAGAFTARMPCAPGDRLYVREEWCSTPAYDDLAPRDMGGEEPVRFRADDATFNWAEADGSRSGRRRAGMHMPRWASRLTLIVEDVRVERLQEISEGDAWAEGVCQAIEDEANTKFGDVTVEERRAIVRGYIGSGVNAYRWLWESLRGADGWAANPFVVAIGFRVIRGNIDQVPA